MKIGKRGLAVMACAVVAAGIGALLFSRYWYYLPGIVQAITDPVQPNREIVWEEGPAEDGSVH